MRFLPLLIFLAVLAGLAAASWEDANIVAFYQLSCPEWYAVNYTSLPNECSRTGITCDGANNHTLTFDATVICGVESLAGVYNLSLITTLTKVTINPRTASDITALDVLRNLTELHLVGTSGRHIFANKTTFPTAFFANFTNLRKFTLTYSDTTDVNLNPIILAMLASHSGSADTVITITHNNLVNGTFPTALTSRDDLPENCHYPVINLSSNNFMWVWPTGNNSIAHFLSLNLADNLFTTYPTWHGNFFYFEFSGNPVTALHDPITCNSLLPGCFLVMTDTLPDGLTVPEIDVDGYLGIDLSDNGLVGTLPASWVNATFFSLGLLNNALSGRFPRVNMVGNSEVSGFTASCFPQRIFMVEQGPTYMCPYTMYTQLSSPAISQDDSEDADPGEDCHPCITGAASVALSAVCSEMGTCVEDNSTSYHCTCNTTTKGEWCQETATCTTDLDYCGDHGTCVLHANYTENCACDHGYAGVLCGGLVFPLSPKEYVITSVFVMFGGASLLVGAVLVAPYIF